MKTALFPLIVLILIAAPAAAIVCKQVAPDGSVSYTDVPREDCRNPVKLPAPSSYTPRELPDSINSPRGDVSAQSSTPFAGYKAIEILQPEPNATVRDNEGKVTVVVSLEPVLQETHRLRLRIDGNLIPGTFDGLSVSLSNVNRGSHSLKAEIVDANGVVQIASSSVTFTLRKASLLDLQREQQDGTQGKSSFVPGDAAPAYSPGSPANFQSSPSGIPSTPGRTNPAFSPNYN